jgi:uncharacterized damage-inducible protein DinB
MPEPTLEPWLQGTLTEFDPLRRAVLHALELAGEDAARWTASLTDGEMFARPSGLPSVAFQMRHVVRSLDRLLTYAEGRPLSEVQLEALHAEMDAGTASEVQAEFRYGLELAMRRVRAFSPERYAEPRGVGRERLPTTVAGLLIHCAEHTQRHAGQMVTTAKAVLATRAA